MNKKLISLILAGLLMFGGAAFAVTLPDLDNYIIESGNGGPNGITPYTVIIKVRNAIATGGTKAHSTANHILSTDCVAWDRVSSDGVSVTKMTQDLKYAFAGVAVTPLLTSDSATAVMVNDKSWGYIAVRGWVLASLDAAVGAGQRLVPADTGGLISQADTVVSCDVGTNFRATTAAGDYMIWLGQ